MADPDTRWKKLDLLGKGGQGEVYRALDKDKFKLERLFHVMKHGINPTQIREEQEKEFDALCRAIVDIVRMEDPAYQGALKILRTTEEARDAELAEERLKREIEAMSRIEHPNLLKVLDYDREFKWYVSEFHPRGSLDKSQAFRGDFVGALREFRRIVDGVSRLHKEQIVHRDIKPQNVFVAMNGSLVLGDFGLAFYCDDQRTRISGSLENVGSRDWMPGWAQGVRIEELTLSFDVFSLGKLLWSMVNPSNILPLWYHQKPKYDLEKLYPNASYINLANKILSLCIVEDEEDCLDNAGALLDVLDEHLNIIDRQGILIDDEISRPCKVCGQGYYGRSPEGRTQIRMDLESMFEVYSCSTCGNVQLFNKS